MSYLGVGNRILPQEWKDFRGKEKWGIRRHKKCWGAVRAFFGTAIKWEIGKGNFIYINTKSVKHWWKSNQNWRESIGFGGNFSRKKLKELLQYKPKIQTTSSEIKAAAKTPIEIHESESAIALKKLCEECDEFLNKSKETLPDEYEQAKKQFKLLEMHIQEWKEWIRLGDSSQLKKCLETMPRVKKFLEETLRKCRKEEINDLQGQARDHLEEGVLRISVFKGKGKYKEHLRLVIDGDVDNTQQFLKDNSLTLPSYKDFDPETERLIQHRWILRYICHEMNFTAYIEKEREKEPLDEKLLQALEKEDIAEAIAQAQVLSDQEKDEYSQKKYEEIRKNLEQLQTHLESIPHFKEVHLIEAPEKLKQRLREIMQFSLQYDRFKTESMRLELSGMIFSISKMQKDIYWKDPNYKTPYQLSYILEPLSQLLPKSFILNIETKCPLAHILAPNLLEGFIYGAKEEFVNKLDDLYKSIDKQKDQIRHALEHCSNEQKKSLEELLETLTTAKEESKSENEIWEELKKIYPKHFGEFPEVESPFGPDIPAMEIRLNIYLQILAEVKLPLAEPIKKAAGKFIEERGKFDHFVFNENTFMEDFETWRNFNSRLRFFKTSCSDYLSDEEKEKLQSLEGNETFEKYCSLYWIVEDDDVFKNETNNRKTLYVLGYQWLGELQPNQIQSSARLRKVASDNEKAVEELRKTVANISAFGSEEIEWEALSESLAFFGSFIDLNSTRKLPDYPTESAEGRFLQKIRRADAIANLREAIDVIEQDKWGKKKKPNKQKLAELAADKRKELARKVLEAKKRQKLDVGSPREEGVPLNMPEG